MKLYRSRKILLVMTSGALFISACASPSKDPLVGASWVASQDITFPPRALRIEIQDGEILARSNRRDRFAGSCEIVSTTRHDPPLAIKKGARFEILRVGYPSRAVNVTTTIYQTTMQVESKSYPDINAINCNVWSSQDRRHMSTDAMQRTMDGLFVLEQ